MQTGSPRVVELRQYTLLPGQRDTLIDLFEQNFVVLHESVGATVLGTFRDLDDPSRFVWLRGFADMDARPRCLTAFYTSPTWYEHRTAVNEILESYDNVLLLRPVGAGLSDPTVLGAGTAPGLVIATIYPLAETVSVDAAQSLARDLAPALDLTGQQYLGSLLTDPSPNNYPALPIREGDNVLVTWQRFAGPDAHDDYQKRLHDSQAWRSVMMDWEPHLQAQPQVLRLSPTWRSALH